MWKHRQVSCLATSKANYLSGDKDGLEYLDVLIPLKMLAKAAGEISGIFIGLQLSNLHSFNIVNPTGYKKDLECMSLYTDLRSS